MTSGQQFLTGEMHIDDIELMRQILLTFVKFKVVEALPCLQGFGRRMAGGGTGALGSNPLSSAHMSTAASHHRDSTCT